jgi:hypothetical protein
MQSNDYNPGAHMNADFNLQRHLEGMESRIREDLRSVISTAEKASDDTIALDGRVRNLEEKAGWIGAGFGGVIVAVLGFVWHIVSEGRGIRP